MTEEQLKSKNPWKEVADMYNPNKENCLYDEDNYYVCSCDKDAIKKYNEKAQGTKDEIITRIPAEPWWGNPFEARLIILSLNPGYVPKVNETLAKLMQANTNIRKKVIEFKKKTLLFETHSFFPEKEDDKNDNYPITCREAVCLLEDQYWENKLKQLKDDVKQKNQFIEDTEFFKQIAMVEYHGYSSQEANRTFPLKGVFLESQKYIKDMLWYIAENKKEDVRFLIMRSKPKWKKLLSDDFFKKFKSLIIEKKNSSTRSQHITPANFENGKYEDLVDFLSKQK